MIDAIDEFVFNCNYANSSNSSANGSKRQLQQVCAILPNSPTYVCCLPSGKEVGQFLALDLVRTFESFRARHRCRIYRCSTRCWTSSQSSCSSRHRTREHLSSPTSPSFVLCSCSYSWSPRAAAGVRRAVAATPVTTAKTGSMSWLNSSPSPWAIRISERGFHYLIFS